MTDDDKKRLPVPHKSDGRAPTVFSPQPSSTGGVVDTWVTGFQAKRKAAAHRQLADLNRAKAEEITAYGELAETFARTARVVAGLDDLPERIALDSEQRAYARQDERDEMVHHQRVRAEEREEEIATARRKKLQSQNFEHYVEETKDINVRIGVARKAGTLADQTADKVDAENALDEIRGSNRTETRRPSGTAAARAELAKQYDAALDAGDHTRAARIRQAIDALSAVEE